MNARQKKKVVYRKVYLTDNGVKRLFCVLTWRELKGLSKKHKLSGKLKRFGGQGDSEKS